MNFHVATDTKPNHIQAMFKVVSVVMVGMGCAFFQAFRAFWRLSNGSISESGADRSPCTGLSLSFGSGKEFLNTDEVFLIDKVSIPFNILGLGFPVVARMCVAVLSYLFAYAFGVLNVIGAPAFLYLLSVFVTPRSTYFAASFAVLAVVLTIVFWIVGHRDIVCELGMQVKEC